MFTGSLRVRVNGILVQNEKMLLVHIQSPTKSDPFWMPPGGGVGFKETLEQALIREIQEETGLSVLPRSLLYVSEYLKDEWHAIEFYYLCEAVGGNMTLGTDPELDATNQMLKDIQWMGVEEISKIQLFPDFLRRDFKAILSGNIPSLRFLSQ